MNFYKLIISYKGTRYKGWQIQPTTPLTIQGQLNKALSKITKNGKVHTIGSGRTDAGVHALGQVVRAEIEISIDANKLMKGLNSLLPEDIEVLSCEKSSSEFQPVFNAKNKTYKYYFSPKTTPFSNEFITHFNHTLDLEAMIKACKLFEGEHDFMNYFCTGTDVSSTIRTVYKCEIEKIKGLGLDHIQGECFVMTINGSGFLKQMVRLIMGALFSVGRGKVSLEQIKYSFETKLKDKLGATASPDGLFLVEVEY